MKFGLDYPQPRLPRTIFYENVCAYLRAHPDFVDTSDEADLVFPIEDTAIETNWPRYRRPESAFLRGSFDKDVHLTYLETIAMTRRQTCVINMHPSLRAPTLFAANPNIIVADVNLRTWERSVNLRTVSMPAMPIVTGSFDPHAKDVWASFRGVRSHPTRDALARLHNGTTFVCQFVEPENHWGKIDAEAGTADEVYVDLLNRSVFAFVPRGDSEFSYRLLEAMSFGCIPVVLADGLVLPFDRTIDWYTLALHVPERDVSALPKILANILPARINAMQRAVASAYAAHFSCFDTIMQSLLNETRIALPFAT